MRVYQVSATQSEPWEMRWSVPRQAPSRDISEPSKSPEISNAEEKFSKDIFFKQLQERIAAKDFENAIKDVIANRDNLERSGLSKEEIKTLIINLYIEDLGKQIGDYSKLRTFHETVNFAKSKEIKLRALGLYQEQANSAIKRTLFAILGDQIDDYLSFRQFDGAVDFVRANAKDLRLTDEQINLMIEKINTARILEPADTLLKDGKFEQAIAFAKLHRSGDPDSKSSRDLYIDTFIINIKRAELDLQIGKFTKNNQFVDAINFVQSSPDKFKDAGYNQGQIKTFIRILELHEFDYQLQIRAEKNIDDAIGYVEAKRNHLEELELKPEQIENIIIELKKIKNDKQH